MTHFLPAPQMLVGEIQKLFPIIVRHIVNARADVMPNRCQHGFVQAGHFGCAQSVFAEQAIDGRGGLGGEKFAAWVGPQIFGGAGDVKRARLPCR